MLIGAQKSEYAITKKKQRQKRQKRTGGSEAFLAHLNKDPEGDDAEDETDLCRRLLLKPLASQPSHRSKALAPHRPKATTALGRERRVKREKERVQDSIKGVAQRQLQEQQEQLEPPEPMQLPTTVRPRTLRAKEKAIDTVKIA